MRRQNREVQCNHRRNPWTVAAALKVFFLLAPASLLPAQSPQILAALAAGAYFPLDVGNRWVFRIDNRSVTAAYQTWLIDRSEEHGGKAWSVFRIEASGAALGESLFRSDDQGRVYLLTGAGEQLFLDPTSPPDPGTTLQITGRDNSFTSTLGTFPDALSYRNLINSLILENGTLVRGIGVVASRQDMLTGSSGGFSESRTLVEAALAGGLRFALSSPSVQLGIESLTLNVSGKEVTNCAVPCYFVACGLVPGADPPDTYKPCARGRIQLENWPPGASRSLRMRLIAPDGTAVFDKTIAGDAALQVPLYSAPNQPLPPGAYQWMAKALDGSAQSSLTVQIR
jgi:hypothetical protein